MELLTVKHACDESGIKQPSELKRVLFSKKDILEIEDFRECFNLQRVDCSGNKIENANGFRKCRSLTWLNLSHNRISSLAFISQLTKLTVLNLGFNQITDLSPLSAIRSLGALIVNSNALTAVSGINQLVRLNTLVLSHNEIAEIDVSCLSQLTKLQLSHNQLTSFPDIRFNAELKSLLLNDNHIRQIPDECIGQSSRLEIVEVGNNRIKKMKSVKSLAAVKSLIRLNLLGNAVCDLPQFPRKVMRRFPTVKILNSHPIHKLLQGTKQASTSERSDQLPVKRKHSEPESNSEETSEESAVNRKAKKLGKCQKSAKTQQPHNSGTSISDTEISQKASLAPPDGKGFRVPKKKRKSFRDCERSAKVEHLDTAADTSVSKHSAESSSRVKRRPAKSTQNSGLVKIVEQSRHKSTEKIAKVEEAFQLDVGVGHLQW